MKIAFLDRLRSLLFLWLLLIFGVTLPGSVHALGFVFEGTAKLSPSNTDDGKPINKAVDYWGCYNIATGDPLNCTFEQRIIRLRPGGRPLGSLEFPEGNVVPNRTFVTGQTFPNFRVKVLYRVPQASGVYEVEGTQTTPPGFHCVEPRCFTNTTWKFEGKADIGVRGLQQLPPAPGLYIRCAITLGCVSDSPDSDPNHSAPFFGKPGLVSLIIGLAAMYRSTTGQIMRITDMSLVKGGVFDLKRDWTKPHVSHRRGTSVDISRFDPASIPLDQEELDKMIIERLDLRRHTETSAVECPAVGEGPPCIHIEL